MKNGAITSVGQPAHAAWSMPITWPPGPKAIFTTWVEAERGLSKRTSSGRVQTIFTGLPPIAFDARAAPTA
jgi:hypothetical protein